MEIMGLHLPGASFVNPNTPLRDALTREATVRALSLTAEGNDYTPIGHIVDEKAIVNGLVGLLATGGSTNHTMHLVAIAAAAGLKITWEDMSELSGAVPLLARVYPNGIADVNHFHAAGGMGFLIRELLESGLPARGRQDRLGRGPVGLRGRGASSIEDKLELRALAGTVGRPQGAGAGQVGLLSQNGGLKLLAGNLGKSVIKVSAVKPENRVVEAHGPGVPLAGRACRRRSRPASSPAT